MIISVYVQATAVCWGFLSTNSILQHLCAPRECSQADSGSRRDPQWPSQNPVAGSTPAGKGACRFAPNDCNGCSVCASDSVFSRNVFRLAALRDPAGERPSFLPSFLPFTLPHPRPLPRGGVLVASLRIFAPAFSECTYTENLASYMCARNQEMAHIRPCKAYSVFVAAHIINEFLSICASNPCLSARAIPELS